jgi:methylaspartate ammonia-lyase
MILKGVDVLPHGLVNNVDEKLGRDGEKLREYIRWLVKRIGELRVDEGYRPALHIDVYGTIGQAFSLDTARIADYLASLETDAGGLPLYIEGPVDVEERSGQVQVLADLVERLQTRGSAVKIVADEWCNTLEDVREFVDARACHMAQIKTPDLGGVQNTVEAVLYCREHGVEAYQGGTCNETDVSARCCVHVAFAARAARMLAKPGMGFDEGYSIVYNEQQRILAKLGIEG